VTPETQPAGFAGRATPPPAGTRRILLVDDSPVIRSAIKIYLDGRGLEFCEAESGARALQIARLLPLSLAVVDFNMPGMTGIAFVEKLRAEGGVNRDVPIVLLTAEKSGAVEAAAKAKGVTAFLRKPVSSAGLGRIVAELVP
jgi:two-component system chemotaxis response regulator CheY